jgi:dTDP-4-amino-4,6-dideoxygalactose transaminase
MKFTKPFSTPDPIPEKGIENANAIMESGHLFRYNPLDVPENHRPDAASSAEKLYSEVALLEQEFCQYTGHQYAVAVNSCGSAMFLAMKAAGVDHGDRVFTNAFTFTAVPSSIVHAGGTPVYLECDAEYLLDLEDFRQKIKDNPDVRYLLLSYMRGHISDVGSIKTLCDENDITLIEDCAHSLGVRWHEAGHSEDFHIGHHGVAACFSAQSNKLINAGEGGMLVTNDPAIAAYGILAAGSYEQLYHQHLARPEDELFETMKREVPNFSLRMSNLSAAVLRPQLPELNEKIAAYNEMYATLETLFENIEHIETPTVLDEVSRVGDSFQFNLVGMSSGEVQDFLDNSRDLGIEMQVFGHTDNARYFRNWKYSYHDTPSLPQTEEVITAACDFRIPLTFSKDDLIKIAAIVRDLLNQSTHQPKAVAYG